jgi:hypothetical protein
MHYRTATGDARPDASGRARIAPPLVRSAQFQPGSSMPSNRKTHGSLDIPRSWGPSWPFFGGTQLNRVGGAP